MNGLFDRILKADLRVFLCIGLLVVGAYSFMLGSPFKRMDDQFSIVGNPEIRDLSNTPQFFQSTYFKTKQDYYRPLIYVTYALEYRAFGLNHFFYNLDNVLLHALNAFLVFWLVALLVADRRQAFWVALLFALHPIHWEAVGNVSGRAILLCATFSFGGIIFFLKFVREKKIGLLIGLTLCYAAALLCKESGGVLIFAAMAFWFIVARRGMREGLVFWPLFVVAAGYVILRHALGIAPVLFSWHSLSDLILRVVSVLTGIFTYLRLFIFPVDLHLDRAQTLYKGFVDFGFWFTLAAVGGCGYLWGRFYQRMGTLASFCFVWFLIELFPVAQIVTVIGVYPGAISWAEHFVYVACVPIFILMAQGAHAFSKTWQTSWRHSPQTLGLVFAGFFLFLFLALVQQNIYASNEFVMLQDSLRQNPRNIRLQCALAKIYVQTGQFDKAIVHFRKAVEVNPVDPTYQIAVAKAMADSGDLLGAAREYEKIVSIPEVEELLTGNKKAVYRLLIDQYEEKIRDAAQARAEDVFALGVFYAKADEKLSAREAFQRAWQMDGSRFDALFNVAVLSEELVDWSRAQAAYAILAENEVPLNTFYRAAVERIPFVVEKMSLK